MTTTNTANELTQAEFSAVQDKIDAMARAARRGTEEQKATFEAANADWETANALPQIKFTDRKVRHAALYAAAVKHNLHMVRS